MTRRLAGLAAMALTVVGGCSTASASPTNTASPGATTPTASPAEVAATCSTGGNRVPGTYALSADDTQTVPATITIPEGWDGCGLMVKEFGDPAGPALIGFWSVDNVYADPCHWNGALMEPAIGQTSEDLARAMVDQALTEASAPTTATIGGLKATYVRLTVDPDVAYTDCDAVDEAEFRLWKGPGDSVWWLGAKDAPGLIGEVWAAEIDGVRVVVQAAYFADATRAEVDEIHAVIDSIAFAP